MNVVIRPRGATGQIFTARADGGQSARSCLARARRRRWLAVVGRDVPSTLVAPTSAFRIRKANGPHHHKVSTATAVPNSLHLLHHQSCNGTSSCHLPIGHLVLVGTVPIRMARRQRSMKRVPLSKRRRVNEEGERGTTESTGATLSTNTTPTSKGNDSPKKKATIANDTSQLGLVLSPIALQRQDKSNAEEPSKDQIALVKRVKVGTTIAMYWDGNDQYYDALVTRWRRRRGVTLFRLLYDDGYGEDDVDLLREKFRIVHVEEAPVSDGVPTGWGEGGMIFV